MTNHAIAVASSEMELVGEYTEVREEIAVEIGGHIVYFTTSKVTIELLNPVSDITKEFLHKHGFLALYVYECLVIYYEKIYNIEITDTQLKFNSLVTNHRMARQSELKLMKEIGLPVSGPRMFDEQ